jgi:hypothetical protein
MPAPQMSSQLENTSAIVSHTFTRRDCVPSNFVHGRTSLADGYPSSANTCSRDGRSPTCTAISVESPLSCVNPRVRPNERGEQRRSSSALCAMARRPDAPLRTPRLPCLQTTLRLPPPPPPLQVCPVQLPQRLVFPVLGNQARDLHPTCRSEPARPRTTLPPRYLDCCSRDTPCLAITARATRVGVCRS